MEPAERQRLREELRQQYPQDERWRQPGEGQRGPGWPEHCRGPSGYPPQAVPYGASPPDGGGPDGRGPRHRMSPEERDQLRMMLRERRNAARRHGGPDDDPGR